MNEDWKNGRLYSFKVSYSLKTVLLKSLLFISILLVWIAQSHMRESWRIGIDEINKSELVTSGLFSYSRNPIFLGIMIANFGLFLILPNAFTLLIISLSTIIRNNLVSFTASSHSFAGVIWQGLFYCSLADSVACWKCSMNKMTEALEKWLQGKTFN